MAKLHVKDGRLLILDKPCDQCPFTGGCELAPGGLKRYVAACHKRGKEKPFICHKTLNGKPTVCRGFHNAYPNCSQIQQIASRLNLIQIVKLEEVELK